MITSLETSSLLLHFVHYFVPIVLVEVFIRSQNHLRDSLGTITKDT